MFIIKVNAQSSTFGVNAGVTLSYYAAKSEGEKDNSKSNIGLTAGVVADLPLSESVSFRPALNFTQMGGNENGFGDINTLTMNYIELPLNFVYKARSSASTFFAGLGPSLA